MIFKKAVLSLTLSPLCALLLLALAACAPRQPAAAGATSQPSPAAGTASAPTPLLSTATAAPTPPVLAEHPTPEMTESLLVPALLGKTQPRLLGNWPSPDGKLTAQVITYDCTDVGGDRQVAYDVLQIAQVSGGAGGSSGNEAILKGVEIDHQFMYCDGMGAFGLGGKFWSNNGRFFYYTNAREGVPDGPCFPWYPTILRYDTTRNVKQDLGGGELSPDKKRLATWMGDDLRIWSVERGDGPAFPANAPGLYYRSMAWSPDSQALTYLINESSCIPQTGDRAWVVQINPSTGETHQLLESITPSFSSLSWTDPRFINLGTVDKKKWRFTFAGEKLEEQP